MKIELGKEFVRKMSRQLRNLKNEDFVYAVHLQSVFFDLFRQLHGPDNTRQSPRLKVKVVAFHSTGIIGMDYKACGERGLAQRGVLVDKHAEQTCYYVFDTFVRFVPVMMVTDDMIMAYDIITFKDFDKRFPLLQR